jgi:uncharacterized protein YndB with AHSA1/START domain
MIERRMTLPASSDHVWEALVDPEILRDWFDADVEWDLVPGGGLTVTEADGSSRSGVVKTVTEGNELQFEWWPEGEEENGSEVTYTLVATDDEETVLTVTERPLQPLDAQMSAGNETWGHIDDALFHLWVRTTVPLVIA